MSAKAQHQIDKLKGGKMTRVRLIMLISGGVIVLAAAGFLLAQQLGWLKLSADETAGIIEIKGDGQDNDLTGTSGRDRIDGEAGNDVLNGGEGNDYIYGGEGNDTINGGRGNDGINGGEGDDTLDGGAGHDLINGGEGNDAINGGEGNDGIIGGEGNDYIYGGEGNDRIDGEAGNDTINGGGGDDLIIGGAGDDALNGGEGDDTIYGDEGNDTLILPPGVTIVRIRCLPDGFQELTLSNGSTIKVKDVETIETRLPNGPISSQTLAPCAPEEAVNPNETKSESPTAEAEN